MKRVIRSVLALAAGTTIFIGVPALCWGIGDLGGFFSHPARTVYVGLMVVLQTFSLAFAPSAGAGARPKRDGAPRRHVDLLLIQILSLSIVCLAPYVDRHTGSAAAIGEAGRYVGLVLVALGFAFMQLAERHLGRQFSVEVTLQENHQLVQHGVYTYVRHPRYLGILLFFAGIVLVFHASWVMVLVLALLAVLVWRVYAEESLLRQEFGQAWDEYRARSWRLIPFVF